MTEGLVEKRAVSFDSDGETIRGVLYLPKGAKPGSKLPGIVTANALTAVKEINLTDYADRFARAGYAALIFDYRYWGESGGEPRHHIAPVEHRSDIQNAVSFLASQKEVDSGRIGGWGISMGGGHMLYLASWEPRFKAVAAVSTGIFQPVDPVMTVALSYDDAKAKHEKTSAEAKAEKAGRKGIVEMQAWCPGPAEGCALPVKEAYDYYMAAKGSFAPLFENRITSTSFRNMSSDDNTFAAEHAKCPVLIIHPDKDIVPVEAVLAFYKRLPEPKHMVVPGGLHTITYAKGRYFEESAAQCLEWFGRYL